MSKDNEVFPELLEDPKEELMQIDRRARHRSLAEAEGTVYKRHVKPKNPKDLTVEAPMPDNHFKQEQQDIANAICMAATLNLEHGQNLSTEEINYIHQFLLWHSKTTKLTLLATITALMTKQPNQSVRELLGELKTSIQTGIQEA